MAPSEKDVSGCLFVSWDVDTTGKRLLDDICNIGAHCSDFSMQQYIMPYKDIMLPMRKRFRLATVTIGSFRVLRDTMTRKIVRTKSELFGLLDFITKLEAQKREQGIVLVCYEGRKLAPYLLIEGLKRYDLLDRFKAVVKGFANGYEFVKVNCAQTMVIYSLNTLAKILLDKEPKKLYDASVRAKLVHEIILHLSTGDSNDPTKDLAAKIAPYVQSFDEVEQELIDYKTMLDKQRTLKPIFLHMIQVPRERKKAIILRQYLTDAAIDYEELKQVVTEERDMKEFLTPKLEGKVTEADLESLVEVIMTHFKPPEKTVTVEKPKAPKKNNKERPFRNNIKNKKKETKQNKTVENGVSETKDENGTNNLEPSEAASPPAPATSKTEGSGEKPTNDSDTKDSLKKIEHPNNVIEKKETNNASNLKECPVREIDASPIDQSKAAKM